ncbi:MAG TPA: adenylosuccinate synthase [Erysipelotrichaceae bacterium]|nr:MAG: adenylosuccinate synthase [Firmicutes bacterium GWE2_51_13]HAM62690.1 adenylosuccinate synthase [Erysipelotrichaceae bacterium]HBZ41067.1 adenylosuccinate synthase [Erysipelotrichaceae bacterium]
MIRAVVGANWGDEGKGKLTDVFAAESDIVVRFQGGNNAGHTIINEYGKFALHMLPSGVFYGHTVNIIGNGVALNIDALVKELNAIVEKGVPMPKILVSDRAQIVMSYHILFDKLEEERLGKAQFGSTKSGIAPFYSDKYAKIGFQISELFDEQWLSDKLERVLAQKNTLLVHLYNHQPLIKEDILAELIHYRSVIAPYVTDTFKYFQEAFDDNKRILLEGQLGALRDPDFGIYPYSTSSSTLALYGPIGAGLPRHIDETWAVTKAYSSCVGAGPFVSEIFDDTAHQLRIRGGDAGEYGATTGRPRRMGWFDAVATRYGCQVQGATHLVLTNLDVLGYLDKIPVCVAYETDGKRREHFPNITRLEHSVPILEYVDGWNCDISHIRNYDELPENCKKYVDRLEELVGVKIALVSNGPKREQIMTRK